jgi:hypothetical protein
MTTCLSNPCLDACGFKVLTQWCVSRGQASSRGHPPRLQRACLGARAYSCGVDHVASTLRFLCACVYLSLCVCVSVCVCPAGRRQDAVKIVEGHATAHAVAPAAQNHLLGAPQCVCMLCVQHATAWTWLVACRCGTLSVRSVCRRTLGGWVMGRSAAVKAVDEPKVVPVPDASCRACMP